MKPSARLAGLKPSTIRRLSDGAPKDAIPFGLGEPTWEMPECARKVLADFHGVCGYGLNVGLPELRAEVARFHRATPEQVVITAGSQEALFSLFMAWLDPGDVVLVPDPGFVAYPAIATLCGATTATYPLAAGDRFRLDAAAFARTLAATPRAKVAVLNLPSNPTAAAATPEALAAVARECESRGVVLVSDEVYRDLFLERRPPSLRDVSAFGVVISSVSKGFACPGLRVGWAVGDERLVDPVKVVHGYNVTAATRTSQLATIALLRESESVLAASRAQVARRFEALRSALKRHLGIDAVTPDGAFYYFLPLPERAHADPLAFCLELRDQGKVVLVPGLAFGEQGRPFARLSYAASPEQIEEGVRRLKAWW